MPTPLEKASSDQVFLEWLVREFDSRIECKERVRTSFPHYEKIIRNPDLSNPTENAIRKGMLFACRGYLAWIDKLRWYESSLDSEDLDHLYLLDGSEFFDRSGQTRLVSDAAKILVDPEERSRLLEKGHESWVRKLETISKHPDMTRKLILIVDRKVNSPYLMEGNHSAVARYIYFKLQEPKPVYEPSKVFIGSEDPLADDELLGVFRRNSA